MEVGRVTDARGSHSTGVTGSGRRPRRDARRNREAILAAARDVFASEGVLAPLDSVAIRARVGNATLYRNFPTREDLLFAVMGSSVAEVVAEGEELVLGNKPGVALTEWLIRLAWRLRIWHDLPHCVADAHADANSPVAPVTATLVCQTQVLLTHAQAVGTARSDIGARDVFELVTAVSWAIDRFGDDERAARRRVLVAIAGLIDGEL